MIAHPAPNPNPPKHFSPQPPRTMAALTLEATAAAASQPLAPTTAGNAADLLDHAKLATLIKTPICPPPTHPPPARSLWLRGSCRHGSEMCGDTPHDGATGLDESLNSLRAAETAIALKSGTIFNIKPGRCGGPTVCLAIMALAKQHGVQCWVGGMLESAVGAEFCKALAGQHSASAPQTTSQHCST